MSATIDLPASAMRALHSAWIDYLVTLPAPIREAMIGRIEGATFDRFILAMHSGRLGVAARIDEQDAFIGVAVPVEGRFDWALFWMNGAEAGLAADYIVAAGLMRLDDDLAELLGGAE